MKSILKQQKQQQYPCSSLYTYKYVAEYENEVPKEIPKGVTFRHLYKHHGSRPKDDDKYYYYDHDPIRKELIQKKIISKLKRPQGGGMAVYIKEMQKQKKENDTINENDDDITPTITIGRAEYIYQWTKLTDQEKKIYEVKYQQLRKDFSEYSKLYPILAQKIIKKRNRNKKI